MIAPYVNDHYKPAPRLLVNDVLSKQIKTQKRWNFQNWRYAWGIGRPRRDLREKWRKAGQNKALSTFHFPVNRYP